MVWGLIGALFIGISLGLLGSGGSILTVPILVYLVGEPEKLAIAESLGIVASISFVGAIPYAIKKEIDWKSLIYFGIPGMIGTYGGASISQYISATVQLLIFAGVMLLAAFFMIKGRKEQTEKREPASKWLLITEGLIVGVITGLVGVGGGFLIIPALVLLGGLSMRLAVGTSLLIITFKSLIGFWKYIDVLAKQDLYMNWDLILIFSLIGSIGSLVGNKVGEKVPQQSLKKGFGYLLVVMGVYIVYSNLA